MKEHLLPVALTCPACGAKLDGALNTQSDHSPREGNPGLCVKCRALLVYTGTPVNSLRYPTPEEQAEFLSQPAVQRAICALRQLHERGPIR